MKILSWNVAGLRAMLKKEHLQNLLESNNFEYTHICLQETKAEESQVILSENIMKEYPFRYWKSSQGITQRKGLSGTTIWSKEKPINVLESLNIDKEGRIVALEYNKYIIVCVYTPNSQVIDSPRYIFRATEWDPTFKTYIENLSKIKPTIICGDFNVAILDIDIHNPKLNKNKSPGFYDIERINFNNYFKLNYIDTYRYKYPDLINKYTYWNQLRKTNREKNLGWRIDYILVSQEFEKDIKECDILTEIIGSDHCPITLTST
jgi:exodeoxyribonuclease III